MQNENGYSRVVRNYSNENLISNLHEYEKYNDELLQAVIWECEVRGIKDPLIEVIQPTLSIPEPEETVIETPVAETPRIQPVIEKIPYPLYSQTAILAFSIFSTFLGGIFLIINLSKVGKKGIFPTLLFCILYSVGIVLAFELTSQVILLLLMNIGGGLILSELLWNHYIGKGKSYKHKNAVIPIIVVTIICSILVYYLYTQYPGIFGAGGLADAPKP